jgi:hypothetical protein
VFDRVICFAAFPRFDNPGQALQEMARVVKTGGAHIVAHLMSRKELAAHHGSHATVARDVLPPDPQMKVVFEHLYRRLGCDSRLCFSGEWSAAICVGSTDHRKNNRYGKRHNLYSVYLHVRLLLVSSRVSELVASNK